MHTIPKNSSDELLELANSISAQLEQNLPKDEIFLKTLLLEMVRVLDLILIKSLATGDTEPNVGDIMVLLRGWNFLLSKTVSQFTHGGIYLREFTENIYHRTATMLHLHGRARTLESVAHSVKVGELNASFEENTWHVSRNHEIKDPFLIDNLEFIKLNDLKEIFDKSSEKFLNGWTIVDKVDRDLMSKIGRFHQRTPEFIGKQLYCDDLHKRIASLVRPFDTGHGVITAYEASPETDAHFIALATEISLQWRAEAGLHPNVEIAGHKMADILKVVLLVISLHLKHIMFCTVAAQKFPEISLRQSLTIWTTRDDLVNSIHGLSNEHLRLEIIDSILELIILKKSDCLNLVNHSPLFIPILIDAGKGTLLRPVSSISQNAFETVKTMLHWRFSSARNLLAAPREDWLRSDIYSMFHGTRYICVSSNIKLRLNNKILTDVDAAIFDRTTGELALFQLKWQDYAGCSPKELRSKAKNLSSEMDAWANAVYRWIEENTVLDVLTTFQIPLEHQFPKFIYLFGVSRRVARTEGYGAMAQHGAIALCNLAQFMAARMEIGPAANVLGNLHERLFREMYTKQEFEIIPTKFSAPPAITVDLKDYFYRTRN